MSASSSGEPPLRPLIVFAHGAGAGASSDFMQKWKVLLSEAANAVEVVTFDYPFMAGGRRGVAPKPETLLPFHKEQIEAAMAAHPGHPLVLVGKSLGSRVSCLLAGEHSCPAKAVVCLGYPIKGANGSIRDKPLLGLKRPVLFVQATRDSMCPLALLEQFRAKMSVASTLYVVEGGDHSLQVGGKKLKEEGTSQEAADASASSAVASFLLSVLN